VTDAVLTCRLVRTWTCNSRWCWSVNAGTWTVSVWTTLSQIGLSTCWWSSSCRGDDDVVLSGSLSHFAKAVKHATTSVKTRSCRIVDLSLTLTSHYMHCRSSHVHSTHFAGRCYRILRLTHTTRYQWPLKSHSLLHTSRLKTFLWFVLAVTRLYRVPPKLCTIIIIIIVIIKSDVETVSCWPSCWLVSIAIVQRASDSSRPHATSSRLCPATGLRRWLMRRLHDDYATKLARSPVCCSSLAVPREAWIQPLSPKPKHANIKFYSSLPPERNVYTTISCAQLIANKLEIIVLDVIILFVYYIIIFRPVCCCLLFYCGLFYYCSIYYVYWVLIISPLKYNCCYPTS